MDATIGLHGNMRLNFLYPRLYKTLKSENETKSDVFSRTKNDKRVL